MKINVDRLCQLAGVERDSSEVLSEASNRSYHDGDNSDEVEFRYGGPGQLAEADDPDKDSESQKALRDFIRDAESGEVKADDTVLAAVKAALDALEAQHDGPGKKPQNEVSGEMEEDMEEGYYEEADHAHEAVYETMEEMGASDDPMREVDPMEEMIEVDEVELVQELRRARKMIAEAKEQKQSLQESELKSIIESEIANVMKDLNLTAGWVYGDKKPKSVKKGYVHQGSFLKGIGFE